MRENGNSTLIETAFRAILDSTRDMMFIKDINSVYVAASEPFVKMAGKTHIDEIVGHSDLEIFDNKQLAAIP